MSSTCRCTRGGNLARSFGHHAPEAPNPSIRCAAPGSTRATGRFCCEAVAVTVAELARCIDESDATSATTAPTRPARRIARIVSGHRRGESVARSRYGLVMAKSEVVLLHG